MERLPSFDFGWFSAIEGCDSFRGVQRVRSKALRNQTTANGGIKFSVLKRTCLKPWAAPPGYFRFLSQDWALASQRHLCIVRHVASDEDKWG